MNNSTDWKCFILSCNVLMDLTDGLSCQSRNLEHTAAQALSASSCSLLSLLMLRDIVDAHIQPFTILFSLHSFIISLCLLLFLSCICFYSHSFCNPSFHASFTVHPSVHLSTCSFPSLSPPHLSIFVLPQISLTLFLLFSVVVFQCSELQCLF